MKHFLIQFVAAKQRLNPRHEFSIVLLGVDAVLYQEFTSDMSKICEKLEVLHPTVHILDCNFDSLFSFLCQYIEESSSRDSSGYAYRGVLIYSRSNVVPTFTDELPTLHVI
eukprot:TRINITY_DN52_c0_g1_i4.p1 TRINITY_DN52_c0_g1~~TRINITY_DN52_c0_g1_i4.p1  ORF type:complete len:111 (-),score=5.15 TRINITY_DN52_c0_g1_i4:449-781(-)